jgi:hypothetical protein
MLSFLSKKPTVVTKSMTFFLKHVEDAVTLAVSHYHRQKEEVRFVDFTVKTTWHDEAHTDDGGKIYYNFIVGHFMHQDKVRKVEAHIYTRALSDGRPMVIEYEYQHTIGLDGGIGYEVQWRPSGECVARANTAPGTFGNQWVSSNDLLTLMELGERGHLSERGVVAMYLRRHRTLGHLRSRFAEMTLHEMDEATGDVSITADIRDCLAHYGISLAK